MSEPAFGQVGDEQPSVVHDEWNVHFLFDLAQDVSDHRIQKELADLVLDRRDGLALEALVISRIFLRPKCPDERVFDLPDHFGAVCVIREHPVDAQKGCVPAFQQCRHGVVEDVFQSRPPGIPPDALERRHDAGRDQMPVIRCDIADAD